MDVIKLLEYLQDIVETSGKMPLTGKVMIDKDEVLTVINQIIEYLPDEMKKAKWICDEKERILLEAKEKADNITKQKLMMLQKNIDNHDLTREAKIKADSIVNGAKKEAQQIRLGSRDYADNVLSDLQNEIDRMGKELMSSLKDQCGKFILEVDENITDTTSNIKNNIKELRDMN